MRFILVSLVWLSVLLPCVLGANTAFADYLYSKGEYYRAITEYERNLYSDCQVAADSSYCLEMIYLCYFKGGEFETGNDFLDKNCALYLGVDKVNFYKGLSQLKVNNIRLAKGYFQMIINNDLGNLLIAIADLYAGNTKSSKKALTNLLGSNQSTVSTQAQNILSVIPDINGKSKSPLLAAALSILPGGGYLYQGAYQTAIASLLLNSLLICSTDELYKHDLPYTGTMAMTISTGFYLGNIYGAASRVSKRNFEFRTDFLNLHIDLLALSYLTN